MPGVLQDQREQLARLAAGLKDVFRHDLFLRVMVDPAFNRIHLAMLKACHPDQPDEAPPEHLLRLQRVALYGGSRHMHRNDLLDVLGHAQTLRWLHHAVWKYWSLATLKEVLMLARSIPQVLSPSADIPGTVRPHG